MRASPYADLNRPPLHESALRRALQVEGGLWTDLRVVAETASTNADVVEAARSGADEGLIVVAESQTAGRGRLTRRWQSPPRAGLTFSVLLRPDAAVPAVAMGWLPLLIGVALAEAVGRIAMVETALKWPNDLLVNDGSGDGGPEYGKCAGVLGEMVPAAAGGAGPPGIVVGVGLNVSQTAAELPAPADPAAPRPTSLAVAGAMCTDRDPLLRGILRAIAVWYGRWRDADADTEASGLRAAYRDYCVTVGREVAVSLPEGGVLHGHASDVDAQGRLVVRTPDGERAVAAGDVEHVR